MYITLDRAVASRHNPRVVLTLWEWTDRGVKPHFQMTCMSLEIALADARDLAKQHHLALSDIHNFVR